jgi:hypothetical protein
MTFSLLASTTHPEAQALKVKAYAAYQEADFAQAEINYLNALNIDPEDIDIRYWLLKSLSKQKKYDELEKFYGGYEDKIYLEKIFDYQSDNLFQFLFYKTPLEVLPKQEFVSSNTSLILNLEKEFPIVVTGDQWTADNGIIYRVKNQKLWNGKFNVLEQGVTYNVSKKCLQIKFEMETIYPEHQLINFNQCLADRDMVPEPQYCGEHCQPNVVMPIPLYFNNKNYLFLRMENIDETHYSFLYQLDNKNQVTPLMKWTNEQSEASGIITSGNQLFVYVGSYPPNHSYFVLDNKLNFIEGRIFKRDEYFVSPNVTILRFQPSTKKLLKTNYKMIETKSNPFGFNEVLDPFNHSPSYQFSNVDQFFDSDLSLKINQMIFINNFRLKKLYVIQQNQIIPFSYKGNVFFDRSKEHLYHLDDSNFHIYKINASAISQFDQPDELGLMLLKSILNRPAKLSRIYFNKYFRCIEIEQDGMQNHENDDCFYVPKSLIEKSGFTFEQLKQYANEYSSIKMDR